MKQTDISAVKTESRSETNYVRTNLYKEKQRYHIRVKSISKPRSALLRPVCEILFGVVFPSDPSRLYAGASSIAYGRAFS